jgi:hypothetical protein
VRILLTAALALVLSAPADATPLLLKRWRPTNAPGFVVTAVAPNPIKLYNDYTFGAQTFDASRAVVHYVDRGINAPPLNDDDGNGVPDYVERVGAAADAAIAYFERRRFARILPDGGGLDARPDIYVSRFSPGTFGVAFPAAETSDGAFAVISNALDPSADRSLGSLYGTVAHELFHLVQFSYFDPDAEPAIPAWTAEGSAAAMERQVFPDLDDLVSDLHIHSWLDATDRPITTQTYGAQAFWGYVDERSPDLLDAYLSELASRQVDDEGRATFAATFTRVAGVRLGTFFTGFAATATQIWDQDIRPFRTLRGPASYRAAVRPFALHIVRLSEGRRGRPTRVAVTFRDRPKAAGVALLLDRRPIRPAATTPGGGACFVIPPARARPRSALVLVVANAHERSVLPYAVHASTATACHSGVAS